MGQYVYVRAMQQLVAARTVLIPTIMVVFVVLDSRRVPTSQDTHLMKLAAFNYH